MLLLALLSVLTVSETVATTPGSVRDHVRIAHGSGGMTALHAGVGFGSAVAVLGDLDRDGVPDVAVGALRDPDNSGRPGAIWILFLRSNGHVRDARRIPATDAGLAKETTWRFGASLAAIGDLDGDGNVDLAVGSSDADANGRVSILFLTQTGAVRDATHFDARHPVFGPEVHGPELAEGLAGLGDLDGDGLLTLAVANSYAPMGGTARGALWLVDLGPDGKPRDADLIAPGRRGLDTDAADHSNFAASVARLGDLDGDGTIEIAVGSNLDDVTTDNDGSVRILSVDADARVVRHHRIGVDDPAFDDALGYEAMFGLDVARLDDLDGDGIPELLTSAGSDDGLGYDRGSVWLVHLDGRGHAREIRRISEGTVRFADSLDDSEWFGSSLDAIGDLDGDGVSEIAVGAPGHASGGEATGSVRILFLNGVGTTIEGASEDPADWTTRADVIDRRLPLPRARSIREW